MSTVTRFALIFLSNIFLSYCYKPVFIIHGVLSENSTMVNLSRIIDKYHPGTRVYVLSRYCRWDSLIPMMHQVNDVGNDLLQISALHPEGFHLIGEIITQVDQVIGFSQGGLLSRAILEVFPYHRVHTFISLSSPQAGQYGTNMLRTFFPNLVKEEAYKIFYTTVGQHISIANYWNDPHHEALFYKHDKFLPVINNETPSVDNSSSDHKRGITKLHRMILIGGPDDGIIEPWQSSHFGYYNENEEIVPMQNRKIYQDDLFGLKSLDARGALKIFTVNGVHHHFWHRNITVIKKYMLPWLT